MKNTADARAIHDTIQRALASAGLDTSSGPMREVTETIRRALGVPPSAHEAAPAPGGAAVDAVDVVDVVDVIDVVAREVPPRADPPPTDGRFGTHTFTNGAGTRAYKLYVPASGGHAPRAMVVMLHGCTQGADDFAAGTRMNRLADEHGFLVVYPEQDVQANASRCWNWFKPQDQRRGDGEPSLIAGIALEVARRHDADPRRVFVAGLSAGAAMAVVLGETYPELFAGVGVHSGLPYGSAHDVPSALAAMKGGRSGLPGLPPVPEDRGLPRRRAVQPVPVIVFHGDRDHTVQPSNGRQVVEQAREARDAVLEGGPLSTRKQAGTAPGGRRYSRVVHHDAAGQAWIESWTLHGGGHAWSGGHAGGTYTDGSGPDASAEMVRFFLALPPAGPGPGL